MREEVPNPDVVQPLTHEELQELLEDEDRSPVLRSHMRGIKKAVVLEKAGDRTYRIREYPAETAPYEYETPLEEIDHTFRVP